MYNYNRDSEKRQESYSLNYNNYVFYEKINKNMFMLNFNELKLQLFEIK